MFHNLHSEETRKKISETLKGNTNARGHILSLASRKKISESNKGKIVWNKGKKCGVLSEEHKRKISDALKGEKNPRFGMLVSPETRKKISIANKGQPSPMKGGHHTIESRRKNSEAHIGHPISETHRLKLIKVNTGNRYTLGYRHKPEFLKKRSDEYMGEKNPNYGKPMPLDQRKKISETLKGRTPWMFGKHHTEETRKKISENRRLDVTDKTYCYKFGIVKPKVGEFFNHICIDCGTPENGRKHHVHHVYYDKKACCLDDGNGGYVSGLGLKNNPRPFKIIGDPNKFVLLCDSCHGGKNGKLETREKWALYYETIINEYYGGRSYCTDEETKTLSQIYNMGYIN